MQSLKPLEKSKKDRVLKEGSFAVFDIEANNWIKHVVNGYFDGNEFFWFKSIRKFIQFLDEHPCPPRHIFSHFGGGYDFLFIFDEVFRRDSATIENIIARGGNILFFDLFLPSTGTRITFHDSSAIFPFGLARLTKEFNVKTKKGEIDYAKIKKITAELLEYLESDCRGLWECLDAYFKTPLVKRAGPAFTSASQAMRIFRCYLKKTIYSATRESDDFIRRGYFGGRVEIFKPYFKENKTKRLHVYDVNSLYPAVMRDNEFPIQEGDFCKRRKIGTMYMAEVTVQTPAGQYLPVLPIVCRKRKKLIFPTGTFRGVYSSVELEYAESLGTRVLKVHRVLQLKNGGKIFKEFINELYKIRENTPKGSVLNYTAKVTMNSLYGRMALNLNKEELKIMGSIEDYENLDEYRRFTFGKREVKLLKGKKTLNSFSQVAIGAWVTSLARIKTHKMALKIKDQLFYMDTDSFFTTAKMETSDKLGELKYEYSFKEWAGILPKTYAGRYDQLIKGKKKKMVMKGFESKKLSQIPFNAFVDALHGDLSRLKIVTKPTHLKFRSALKKNKFLVLGKKQVKRIKSKYDKREIIPTRRKHVPWDSKPWELKEE